MLKKSQNMPVWLSIFAQFAKVDKMQNKVVHLPKKVINIITLGAYFLLVNHNNQSRWFSITCLSPICSIILGAWARLQKSK
jgi:hypothetical protein